MSLHVVDQLVIFVYLIVIVIAGVLLTRRAGQSMDSYFLGGRSIPWYVLGISNASGMFDIAGTMWLITILFVYGVKSLFFPWLWPTFNQIFLMMFLAAWLRRSRVLTGAEWLRTRFGQGLGLELSHISVVIFALVAVIGFLAYAFAAIGKFAAIFFPPELMGIAMSPERYALVLMSLTALYVIAGGMYSVVVTDVIQFLLMAIVSFAVAAIAFRQTTAAEIMASVPNGWADWGFLWRLDLDWGPLLPALQGRIAEEQYQYFGPFLMLVVFKGILSSIAGPAPGYDMQRVLATRSPRESALMSGIVSPVLMVPRYFFVAGIGVLALVHFSKTLALKGQEVDFEQILPLTLDSGLLPVGLVGLTLAGLLAAFMSTFDSTVNAGAAYLVNDVYKRYIAHDQSNASYVRASYLSSLLVVVVGMAAGYQVDSIDDVLNWITAGLYGGFVAPNLLKWIWWRLNGFGYFLGMITGTVAAIALLQLSESAYVPPFLRDPLHSFPLLLAFGTLASIGGSLLTPPDDPATLREFYRRVRPWGFWGPVIRDCQQADAGFLPNRSMPLDLFNCLIGTVWQLGLCAIPVLALIRQWIACGCVTLLVAGCTLLLKFTWFDRLSSEDFVESSDAEWGRASDFSQRNAQ